MTSKYEEIKQIWKRFDDYLPHRKGADYQQHEEDAVFLEDTFPILLKALELCCAFLYRQGETVMEEEKPDYWLEQASNADKSAD